MAQRYTNRDFWRSVRRIKAALPLEHPVCIRTVADPPGPDESGNAIMRYDGEERRFVLIIHRGLLQEMRSALAHDWAHFLHWSKGSVDKVLRQRMEHSAEWGASYAKCYRIVFETEN